MLMTIKYSRCNSHLRAVIVAILMLMLCMSIFVTTTLASTGEVVAITDEIQDDTPLVVNAAWLDGDTIRIDVTDPQTGAMSAIAVPVSAYLRDGENVPFIAIQAVDLNGRQSGVIEIRNPFFDPNLPTASSDANSGNETGAGGDEPSVSAIEPPNADNQPRPLTPDGTGTVVDNVTDNDREFFTIFSDDGSEFFLIIDRHRDTENVYFLNAVTIEDLMSLARDAGREIAPPTNNSTSAIPAPTQPDGGEQDTEIAPPITESEPENNNPTALSRIGSNLAFFVGIIVVVGGVAYYLKVVRPKKNAFSDSYADEPDDYGYEDDDDDENEQKNETEDGDAD